MNSIRRPPRPSCSIRKFASLASEKEGEREAVKERGGRRERARARERGDEAQTAVVLEHFDELDPPTPASLLLEISFWGAWKVKMI